MLSSSYLVGTGVVGPVLIADPAVLTPKPKPMQPLPSLPGYDAHPMSPPIGTRTPIGVEVPGIPVVVL